MDERSVSASITRRDLLKVASAAVAAGAALELGRPAPAGGQTPKRGGIFRIRGK